jgi:phosphate:Na+ symporter
MQNGTIDIWLLLAGIGIFLFGIYLLEESIKLLSGRAFKAFIRKYTATPIKGILSGTIATALLQSSSAVMLMVLAFAGAGIMQLRNAISVIFGSNLGTTLTSWLVATLGFKIDIESISLPIIGIGGLGLIFLGKSGKWANFSKLLVGFGFLFMGLDYMKSSIDGIATHIDFEVYRNYPAFFFLVAGFILTAIVQSSSAAMAIILSLLFSKILQFDQAAAMVIGTNMGTTITVFIGSINGPPVKKQISWSHFSFNFITGIITLIFLPFFTWLVLDIFNMKEEPVLALALFHTLFNVFGILLFLPFIPKFSKLLIQLVPEKKNNYQIHLPNLIAEVPEAGLKIFKDTLIKLLYFSSHFNLKVLKIDSKLLLPPNYDQYRHTEPLSIDEHFKVLNDIQIQLISFAAKIQQHEMTPEESSQFNQLLLATRYFVTSAKSIKDTMEDMAESADAENEFVRDIYQNFRKFGLTFFQKLITMQDLEDQTEIMTGLHRLRSEVIKNDVDFVRNMTSALANNVIRNEDANTLIAASRGFILSCRQMVIASREMLLSTEQAKLFENLEKIA